MNSFVILASKLDNNRQYEKADRLGSSYRFAEKTLTSVELEAICRQLNINPTSLLIGGQPTKLLYQLAERYGHEVGTEPAVSNSQPSLGREPEIAPGRPSLPSSQMRIAPVPSFTHHSRLPQQNWMTDEEARNRPLAPTASFRKMAALDPNMGPHAAPPYLGVPPNMAGRWTPESPVQDQFYQGLVHMDLPTLQNLWQQYETARQRASFQQKTYGQSEAEAAGYKIPWYISMMSGFGLGEKLARPFTADPRDNSSAAMDTQINQVYRDVIGRRIKELQSGKAQVQSYGPPAAPPPPPTPLVPPKISFGNNPLPTPPKDLAPAPHSQLTDQETAMLASQVPDWMEKTSKMNTKESLNLLKYPRKKHKHQKMNNLESLRRFVERAQLLDATGNPEGADLLDKLMKRKSQNQGQLDLFEEGEDGGGPPCPDCKKSLRFRPGKNPSLICDCGSVFTATQGGQPIGTMVDKATRQYRSKVQSLMSRLYRSDPPLMTQSEAYKLLYKLVGGYIKKTQVREYDLRDCELAFSALKGWLDGQGLWQDNPQRRGPLNRKASSQWLPRTD